MSEALSEVTPTKKMKQSRLPFQVLPASSPQPGKKRKLSGEDAGSVPKSPRSSAATADVENIPITVSPEAEASSTKKTADAAEIPKKGMSIKTFFHKTSSGVVKEEGSPKQQVEKEVIVVIDDSSRESLPRGQEQADKSQERASPTSVEKEAAKTPGEPLSSTPSCSANVSESEDMADAMDTTDTSCRETSFQSEEQGSTPGSQEASPTASCNEPDGKAAHQDGSALEPSGKELDGKNEAPKAAKSAKPVQTLTKAEREKQRQEKLAERERQRKERAEQKAKREEEKLAKQKLREESRLRKQQLLEELSKQKEERKRAKQEELQKKEEEKQKREEEKQKREEEKQKKEEERQKKEEERLRKEEEKKRAKEEQEKKQQKEKAVFANFFVKRTEPKQANKGGGGGGVGAFRPFQLKDGMTLAPFVPQDVLQRFDASALDQLLQAQDMSEKGWLARKAFSRRTLQTPRREEQHPRAKLLQFCENVRPAYWGTWRKKSQAVRGRRPWGKEKELDYDVDSEEEWEEDEPGESLSGTEDEKESEDDYEVDNDVFVPHGYLSEDEEKGDDDPMTPETLKARLKLRQEELQAELKGGTARPLRPLVVGCIWQTLGSDPSQQGLGCLDQFAAVRLTLSFRPSWEVREEALQKSAAPLPDAALSLLASLVHNRAVKKTEVMQEFGSSWDGGHVPRKKLLEALQGLGAQRSGGRWLLAPDTLERLGLSHLALPVPAAKEAAPKATPKAMPPGPLERFLSSAAKDDKANQSRLASPTRKALLLVKPQMPTMFGPGSCEAPIILEEESEDTLPIAPPDESPASTLAEGGPHVQKTTLCT